MSDRVTLTLRNAPDGPIRVHGLHPDRLSDLTSPEIAALRVSSGRQAAQLGDFFAVNGERSSHVRVEGSTRLVDGLGAGMLGGELVIDGDAGAWTGAGMGGGTLQVHGRVGDAAGVRMSGGVLRIDGNAGDRLGANAPGAAKGMTGGEIIVGGSTGVEAGARMRRGLIVICGDVGRDAGRAMIAGSLYVFGACGDGPGRGSKRGTIVACGDITVPPTYRFACTYQPPHVRLTLLDLLRRHGLKVDASLIDGTFRRYCGDAGDPGKGEILERVRP